MTSTEPAPEPAPDDPDVGADTPDVSEEPTPDAGDDETAAGET